MKTTVKERLIAFIEHEQITKSQFCKIVGVSSAYISSMRQSISNEKMQSIALKFPNLNITWLLTGEGEMLRENCQKTPDSASLPEVGYSGSEMLLMRIIEGKDAKIEELSRRIGELEAENRLLKENHIRDMAVSDVDSAVAG